MFVQFHLKYLTVKVLLNKNSVFSLIHCAMMFEEDYGVEA